MKWYMGTINPYDRLSKKRLSKLFEKNFKIHSPRNGMEIYSKEVSYAEIYNCNYSSEKYNEVEDDILILGDIEIYNTVELMKKYFNNNESLANNLLISMYRSLGISFVKELSGEYSFMLYDREKKLIYFVTDHLGIKPLFWTICKDKIYFASDLFLLSDYYDMKDLNNKYFVEYYNNFGQVTNHLTPYVGVNRVESGSYIYLSLTNFSVKEYKHWDLSNLVNYIRYDKEEEYIHKFSQLLESAIDNRLLKNNRDGVLMSGGLDSTSIYAIGKNISSKDLIPFCGVFDTLKDCDERYYIEQVLDMYGQETNYVISDSSGMLNGYPNEYFYTYEPHVNMLTFKFTGNLIKEAAYKGIQNILSGYAADHILKGSLVGVIDNLRLGKLLDACKYIKDVSLMMNKSVFSSIKEYIIDPLIMKESFPDFDSKFYLRHFDKVNKIKSFNKKEIFMQICNINGTKFSDREISPRYNISMKHPFLDKDLIEYIFKIPGMFRLNKKYSKYILRESVKNLLPEEVINRIQKTDHVSLTFKGISDIWNNLYTVVKDFKTGDMGIVNINKIEWQEELYKFRSGQEVREDFYVILSMELWFYDYHIIIDDYKGISDTS